MSGRENLKLKLIQRSEMCASAGEYVELAHYPGDREVFITVGHRGQDDDAVALINAKQALKLARALMRFVEYATETK